MQYILMRKVLKVAQQRRTKKSISRTKKSISRTKKFISRTKISISSYRNSNFSLFLCSLIRRTKKTQTKKLQQTEIVHSLFPKPVEIKEKLKTKQLLQTETVDSLFRYLYSRVLPHLSPHKQDAQLTSNKLMLPPSLLPMLIKSAATHSLILIHI